MISITFNQQYLDLPKGKISFEMNFPGLDADAIKQSFSFPCVFPPTSSNDRAFKHSRLLSVPLKLRELTVDVLLSGNFWRKAKIIISEVGTDGYRGSIVLDEMFVDQVDRSLKELDFGEAIFIGETPEERVAYAKSMAYLPNYLGSGNPITFFPVHNPWFYGGAAAGEDGYGDGENPDFCGTINYFGFLSTSEASQTFLHNVIPVDDSSMNQFSLVPFIYHHFLLEKIFKPYNVSLNGSFWNNPECRSAILWNNHPLDYKRRRRYLRASIDTTQGYNIIAGYVDMELLISAPEDEDNDSRFNPTNNRYYAGNSGAYRIKIDASAQGFNYSTMAPLNCYGDIEILVIGPGYEEHYIIADSSTFTASAIGSSFTGEYDIIIPGDHSDVEILLRARCLQSGGLIKFTSGFITIENFRASDLNEFSPSIELKNHVPDSQITTYLNELRKFFGISFLFNPITRELSIDFIRDYLGNSKIPAKEIAASSKLNLRLRERSSLNYKFDWGSSNDDLVTDNFKSISGLNLRGIGFSASDLQEGDCILRPDISQIHVYRSGSLQYFTDYFPEQTYGQEKEIKEVAISMTPMLMHWKDFGEYRIVMPKIKQQANSPVFNLDNINSSLKTTFFRGRIWGVEAGDDERLVPSGSSMAIGQWDNEIGMTCMSFEERSKPGLYSQFLKPMIDIQLYSDLLITKVKLTTADLLAFSWKRRLLITNVQLIPSKISFETDAQGITESEIEMYTDFAGYHG